MLIFLGTFGRIRIGSIRRRRRRSVLSVCLF